MIEWLTHVYSFIIQTISVGGPHNLIAILGVAGFSEFGVPFPLVVDTLLFVLGYRIANLWLETILVVLVLMAGRVIGSSLVYLLAHTVGSPILHWLGRHFPHWRTRVDKISRRFVRKSSLTAAISRISAKASLATSATGFRFALPLIVASGRLTPGMRGMTVVASGTLGFRYRYFALGIGMASFLSDIASLFMGVVTGYGLRQLNIDPSSWLIFVTIAINIGIIMVMQRFLWGRLAAKFV